MNDHKAHQVAMTRLVLLLSDQPARLVIDLETQLRRELRGPRDPIGEAVRSDRFADRLGAARVWTGGAR